MKVKIPEKVLRNHNIYLKSYNASINTHLWFK